jgi:hypothetical protein
MFNADLNYVSGFDTAADFRLLFGITGLLVTPNAYFGLAVMEC